MRKKTMKMMIIAGAVALLLPTAAMAEWDQTESHLNQDSHDAMFSPEGSGSAHVTGDFNYGQNSAIGYDYKGDGTATLVTNRPKLDSDNAPWNTTPCPIQLADTTPGGVPYSWADAMGNCPTQNGWTTYENPGQTDANWGEGDNEQFGVILDDLYQSLTETATTPDNDGTGPLTSAAFKKADQVLDILFYKSNSVGEVFLTDGWHDGDVHWFGGLGIDQTLDQDIADITGTTGNKVGQAPNTAHGQWLWAYDHMAQTFYQDFRIWDKGNTSGPKSKGAQTGVVSPRNRHGLEILSVCDGCTYDTGTADGWGEIWVDAEDFGFFDQWVIQSMKDSYATGTYDGNGSASGYITFTGNVTLKQSYSSWMVQGQPGSLCSNGSGSVNSDGNCNYVYDKAGHEVNKSIATNTSKHQTGDP